LTKSLVNLYFQANPAKEDKQESFPLPLTDIKNQIQNYSLSPKIQQEINEIKTVCKSFIPNTAVLLNEVNKYDTFTKLTGIKSENNNIYLTGALSSLPIVKRYETLKNNNNSDNNPFRIFSLSFLGVINLNEDLRDALSIFGKTEAQAPKDYFVRFKFFAGTSVENFLMKSDIGRWILGNVDRTLVETKPLRKLLKLFKIKNEPEIFEKTINYPIIDKQETVLREYVKLQGSLFKKTLILTANRITLLGLIFLGLLELPKVIDSLKKKDYKQAVKSAVTVIATLGTGALLSSFLAITTGTAGSVLGFGFGMFLGNKFSKFVNSNFF